MPSAVLVVDDEKDVVDLLKYNLEAQGFRVLTARDGNEALERAFESRPDLIVLDLLLPVRSGIEVLRELRADPATRGIPVLLLTAKGDEVDRLSGFEAGADDYVVKPFSPREVMARIRAILRRGETGPDDAVLRSGDLAVDVLAHEARVKEKAIPLTAREFDLLVFLLRNTGRAVRREEILNKVWGYDYFGETRTVDVHVRRLRVKLGASGKRLSTVPSVGYRWTESPAGKV